MARAFVFPYTGVRVDGADIVLSMPVNYVTATENLSGPALDVRVPIDATPQQIRTAIIAEVVLQAPPFGVTIGQNETILFGYDKG